MIPNRPPPRLKDESKWSKEFVDFIARCLVKNPEERLSAHELLEVSGVWRESRAAPLRGGDVRAAASRTRRVGDDAQHGESAEGAEEHVPEEGEEGEGGTGGVRRGTRRE